jgi:UrcA family protein
MFAKISSRLMSGAAASAVATLALSFAGHASAQAYNDPAYDRPAYDQPNYDHHAYDAGDSTRVGDLVVTPEYRPDRSIDGIPTQRVYASRVVYFDDLDLNTAWGVHELHARVVRAATEACNQLDNEYPMGLVPIDSSDGDCKARAIRHAMANAPIGDAVDTDYRGY